MKLVKNIITLIALFLAIGLSAQNDNKQVVKESMTNKFSVKSEKGMVDYVVKIDTKATSYVKMDDLSKKEETRLKDTANVVTTINVDSDSDPFYDNAFTLTYPSSDDNSVKVEPTTSGFNILVAGEVLQYDFIQKVCNTPAGCPVKVEKISITQR
ncbi:MAG: hypothetical protein R2793_05010 [Flavobacteriaceae bacterium]